MFPRGPHSSGLSLLRWIKPSAAPALAENATKSVNFTVGEEAQDEKSITTLKGTVAPGAISPMFKGKDGMTGVQIGPEAWFKLKPMICAALATADEVLPIVNVHKRAFVGPLLPASLPYRVVGWGTRVNTSVCVESLEVAKPVPGL